MKIRQARFEDLDHYASLQAERWSDDNQATRAELESRFATYPKGMLVAEEAGQVVGMVFAMRIAAYNYDQTPSWYEITNDGKCDTHDPNGPIIFGVDLSTSVGVGARAGDQLLVAVARLAIRENIKWCMLGGRLPGYHNYQSKMSAAEYLRATDANGLPLDPQVRFYTSQAGLVAVKVLPDYFEDPDSCDYGVLLRWHNPLYGLPGRRFFAAIFPLLFRLENTYLALSRRLKTRSAH
jgi:hypothetical protein